MLSFGPLLSLVTYFTARLRNGFIIPSPPYYSPNLNGGSMLIDAGNGLGEPLNVCEPLISYLVLFIDILGRSLFLA